MAFILGPSALPLGKSDLVYLIAMLAVLLFGSAIFLFAMRKLLRGSEKETGTETARPAASDENASSFAAASMQAVIERLRSQEKELARLHQVAQERARESERLSEEVTRNMPTGLLLVSATGAITGANPAAEETLGIRPLRYRSYLDVLGEDSDLARMLSECLREAKTFQRGEIVHMTPHAELRHLGVTISPTRRARKTAAQRASLPSSKSEEPVSGALCLMSDLTELAALQGQMRLKENLAALGEMSAGIAHEFKNALATVSGYAQMIRSESKPGDVRESAERILDQTRALTHVVTEFLRFARPLEISYETVPMRSVVERVAAEIRESMHACTVALAGDFEELAGDEALIRQALLNLARNGAQAAASSGAAPELAITGTIEELGGKKWQRISIGDNGPGIPEHEIPKIFLPFYTTKAEGTGLGLAVVQKVALQHGGSIEARNRESGGAEFLLWLPLKQEPLFSSMASDAAHI